VYSSSSHLTQELQHWQELGVRGSYATGAHVWGGEVASMRRFGESGTYLGLSETYTFNPDWFGNLSIGAGDGASYLPEGRADAFINHKLLADRNLIATLGTGYYRAPDNHNDRNLSLGATYYFSEPLILQGEVRINFSRPGNVKTRQQFLALTWGRAQATQITARYAWGREGYQTIGNGGLLVNFSSHQSSLALRHWIGSDWGLAAGLEHYHNKFYERVGITFSLFLEQP
jgi:YaiO family outer membrane protein